MKLQLRYTEKFTKHFEALFVRGRSAFEWLKQIDQLSLDVNAIECYPVPESISSLKPVGIFIILKSPLPSGHFLDPYTAVGEKLFVPANTQLYPPIKAEELDDLLLYSINVFHPSIGLIGFDPSDQVNLADLILLDNPTETDWSFADLGLPVSPGLKQIQVQQPTMEEVMEGFKKAVENKKGKSEGNDVVGEDGAEKVESDSEDSSENPDKSKGQSTEDLNKKRNKEIDQLLDLFDKDTDEALKFAPPLESPYLNRGTAIPTSRLSPGSAEFSLDKLGGGQVADSWDIGRKYYALRMKYQKAAEKEIANKNFKKAAYIYAHLLGDFSSAANVLEQGEFYREAAVLYKEHLKNIPLAAECLERGGYYPEAVDLYLQNKLDRFEKVGDLYKKMNQREESDFYYELSIESVLKNGGYMEASRILKDKLEDRNRAKDILLEGWKKSHNGSQGERCLKSYFDEIISAKEQPVSDVIEEIGTRHTERYNKIQFLNVLSYVHAKDTNNEWSDTTRKIAYQMVSEEAVEGNISSLNILQNFISDPLLSSDISRYSTRESGYQKQQKSYYLIHPDHEITWIKAIVHKNQFIAIGLKDSKLLLTRGNWSGNFEYYSWEESFDDETKFDLVADPNISNKILLYISKGIPIQDKVVRKNKYFGDQLTVTSPWWLADDFFSATLLSNDQIGALKITSSTLEIHYYNFPADLNGVMDCDFPNSSLYLSGFEDLFSGMIFRTPHYFAFKDNYLLKISEAGKLTVFALPAEIKSISISPDITKNLIAISTDEGVCVLESVVDGIVMVHDLFAPDLESVDLQFVSPDVLVIASRYKVIAYQVGNKTPKEIKTIKSSAPVVSILTTGTRNQFSALSENGELLIYEV